MNIVLIGKPGAGKGSLTQQLISYDNTWYQLAPGEVMREKMKNDNDDVAQTLRHLLGQGNYAPDHITISIVKEKIANLPHNMNVIFDGFPRTAEQAKMLAENFHVDLVIYLDTPDEVVKERLPYRLNHPASGRVYNEITHPPINAQLDDVTHEPLIKRADDKPELIEQRIKNFFDKTYPAYQYLVNNTNMPCITIDAQLTETEIFSIVKEHLYKISKTNKNVFNK